VVVHGSVSSAAVVIPRSTLGGGRRRDRKQPRYDRAAEAKLVRARRFRGSARPDLGAGRGLLTCAFAHQ
jgi:hypothetical protein